jgi:hypothetical protein
MSLKARIRNLARAKNVVDDLSGPLLLWGWRAVNIVKRRMTHETREERRFTGFFDMPQEAFATFRQAPVPPSHAGNGNIGGNIEPVGNKNLRKDPIQLLGPPNRRLALLFFLDLKFPEAATYFLQPHS